MHLMNNEENHFFGVYDNDKYYVNKRTSKKTNNNNNKSKGTSKSTSKPSGGGSKSTTSSSSGNKSSSGATPTSIKNADNRATGYKPASSGYKSTTSSSSGYKSSSGATPTSVKNADNRATGYKPASSGYKSTTSSSSGYKSSSGATPTSIKNADNRVTGYKPASSGYKPTISFSSDYKPSSGATPTSIKNADNRKTGYKPADSGYQYLKTAKAKILNKKDHYIDGSIGHNFKRKLAYDEFDLYNDINIRGKNRKANDLYSFINSVSKHTPIYYEKGEKLYVVDNKTAGTLSVGPGIVLKYNNDYFKKYGLDVSNLREGAAIPASIVDKVTNDILADKRKYVLNVLETNNIKGLSDSQIDALTSRAYSVGNISNFPNMYKQYGNTEELYKNYLSTVNGKDTIYEKELTERRNAEINLFKNGYSSVEKENLRPGLTPTAINKLEKIKRSKKTPTAINSQDRLKDGYVNNDGILSNLRPGLTPSEINRQDKMEYNKTSDPLADYLDNLKAKGVDVSDITNGNIDILTKNRITNNNYTEEDINKFKNILWHEYGGSLTGNFSDDTFTLLTIGATVVNNATAYGGKDSNKSWANSLEDAITDRKYLYENGRNYIYGTYNPKTLGVSASTDALLTEVAKLCLSGEYTIPSNLRGQSARYIMDSYDDKNNIHYLAGNEWYSDNNHDVVIYPLNEGKKNDKTVYTAEVSDVDIFGNKFKTTDSEAFKLYAESLAPKILENDLVRSKYPDYEV